MFCHFFCLAISVFKARRALLLENLILRQQLAVLERSIKRRRLSPIDRLFWILLSKYSSRWRQLLRIVTPDTVVRWHRQGFRRYWTRNSRRLGRPPIDLEIRKLIRQMQSANFG
jgi:hypothetical protein